MIIVPINVSSVEVNIYLKKRVTNVWKTFNSKVPDRQETHETFTMSSKSDSFCNVIFFGMTNLLYSEMIP